MDYAFIHFAGNEIQKTEELALQALVKLGYYLIFIIVYYVF